jgi:hypothetical protein
MLPIKIFKRRGVVASMVTLPVQGETIPGTAHGERGPKTAIGIGGERRAGETDRRAIAVAGRVEPASLFPALDANSLYVALGNGGPGLETRNHAGAKPASDPFGQSFLPARGRRPGFRQNAASQRRVRRT